MEWGNTWGAFSTILDLHCISSTIIMTISSSSIHQVFVFMSVEHRSRSLLQTWERPWLWPVLPEEFLQVLPAARGPWEHPIVSGQRGRHDVAFRFPAGVAFPIVNHAETTTQRRKQKAFWEPVSQTISRGRKRCIENQGTQVRDRVTEIVRKGKDKTRYYLLL